MRRMRSLLIDAGVQPEDADRLFADLVSRYAEPHRRYHTGAHIEEVMTEADRLLRVVSCTAGETSAVRLAVWFHDAIYDPTLGGGVNEEASAELASATLSSVGVARPIMSEVARLVRLTADHEVDPTDVAGSVLVDADLSILAADADRYDRYVGDVRAEYAHIGDDAWSSGRSTVLRRFLDAVPLYRTGPDRELRERAARANLQRELDRLTGLRLAGDGEPDGAAGPPRGAGERARGG